MWHELIVDPDPSADPAVSTIEADTREKLAEKLRLAIRLLPIEQSRVITLIYFDELTYAEAAAQCGKSVNTVKTQVRQAKNRLFKILTADDVFNELIA